MRKFKKEGKALDKLDKNHKVCVIIPAFNEKDRISSVLEVVLKVPIIDEVIVVDDGSTDGTFDVASRYSSVRVIKREQNGGKGAAMQTGIESTDADIIAFIDADLVGMKPYHIESLISPLLQDEDLMMTVGKFTGGRLSTDLAQAIVPVISGQRAVRKQFFEGLSDLGSTGYGVEIAITKHAKQNDFKVVEIELPELTQVMKEEKMGIIAGFKNRMKMYADIAKQLVMK